MKRLFSFILFAVFVLSTQVLTPQLKGSSANYPVIPDWKEQKYFLVLTQLSDQITIKYPDVLNLFSDKIRDVPDKLSDKIKDGPRKKDKFSYHLFHAIKCAKGESQNILSHETRFGMFIDEFRKALKTEYYANRKFKPEKYVLIELAQNIAHMYYTKIDIQNFMEEILSQVLSHGGVDSHHGRNSFELYSYPLSDLKVGEKRLQRLKSEIEKIYDFQKGIIKGKSWLGTTVKEKAIGNYYGGVVWSEFDPTMQGNLTYRKYNMIRKDKKEPVIYIRMPTPTLNSNHSTEVNPEFEAYLHYLKNKNLKHTYLNFQDSVDPGIKRVKNLRRLVQFLGFGNESHRAKTIQDIEFEEEFTDVIQVLTLSRDSGFYRQSGKREKNITQSDDFIKDFLWQLFNGEYNGFHVPRNWKENESTYCVEIQKILDFVHRVFFNSKPVLSRHEKRVFIEISYGFISDFAVSDSYSVNQTCKSGIDRAGSANAMTLFLTIVDLSFSKKYDEINFDKLCNILLPMLFEDALLAKMREIKGSRLRRFNEAALKIIDTLTQDPSLSKDIHEQLKSSQIEI